MPEKYEVVISGMSGRFPQCSNTLELQEKLMNKTNLVMEKSERWDSGCLDIPVGIGELKNATKFDYMAFGIHRELYESLDPVTYHALETSIEAVIDAGYSPAEIKGTNAAVISIVGHLETMDFKRNIGYMMLGQAKCMNANRLSYFLDINGPSYSLDPPMTGSLDSLALAYDLISTGFASAVLINATQLILKPALSYHLKQMGKLSSTGRTRPFSNDADGFTRSEASVSFFIQRAQDARRSYGSITNIFSQFINDPMSCNAFQLYKAIKDLYIGIEPNNIAYVELTGSGDKQEDAAEINLMDKILSESRRRPLPIGSIKSNLGHSEFASSLVSVVKSLIALNSGIIPPNINYSTPNSLAAPLSREKLKVITEPTPLEGSFVAVHSNGECGIYGHAIIKRNPKYKMSRKKNELPPDGIPRIVILSGRNEEALEESFKKVDDTVIDEEFTALIHKAFGKTIKNHSFRGYKILDGRIKENSEVKISKIGQKQAIWYVFSGMGSQWPKMGAQLMKIPMFAESVQKCQEALQPKGIDIIDIIVNSDTSTFDNILYSFVGIATIQVGLVDLLKAVGVEPEGMVGHSVGELGCAYADGCFTAEQMVLAAYARGLASLESDLIRGKMAVIGLGYDQVKNDLPASIEVACRNSSDNCTLSGPEKDMEIYIAEKKKLGVFARLVNVANIAYHSRYIAPAAPALLRYLKEIIPIPKKRSERWISSSVPERDWENVNAKYSSAEYHTNNLLSPVLFEEALKHVPENAIIIEIAPHGLLQAILKRSKSECKNIALTNRNNKDGLIFLLESIGKLYLEGLDLQVENIYPKVEFPVSRNTPPIHPLFAWDHESTFGNHFLIKPLRSCSKTVHIKLNEETCEAYSQQKIHNQYVVPSSMFINTIIELFVSLHEENNLMSFVMQNLSFTEILQIKSEGITQYHCVQQRGSGDFEVVVGENIVLKGNINTLEDNDVPLQIINNFEENDYCKIMSGTEIYGYMSQMGLEQGEPLRNIKEFKLYKKGAEAKVLWEGNWVLFINALLKIICFYETIKHNKLRLVRSMKKVVISPLKLNMATEIDVRYNSQLKTLNCEGVQMLNICTKQIRVHDFLKKQKSLGKNTFVPYGKVAFDSLEEGLLVSAQLVIENYEKSTECNQLYLIGLSIEQTDNDILNLVEKYLLHHSNLQVRTFLNYGKDGLSNSKLQQQADNYSLTVAQNIDPKVILKNISSGFLLCISEYDFAMPPKDEKAHIVIQTQIGNKKIVLFKKQKVKSVDLHKTMISTLDNEWEKNLKHKLQEKKSLIYLLSRQTNFFSVFDIINSCEKEINHDNLRYIFVDDDAPKFSLDLYFYKNQLKQNLKINVNKNGTWGSYKLLPVKSLEFEIDEPILQLNLLKSPGVKIKYLGLNLPDITPHSYDSRHKLGILDYIGIDESGKELMGLGSISGNILTLDSALKWLKPQDWNSEEAASVPLIYSFAYYIFSKILKSEKNPSILIHDGCSLLSQAIIRIAMRMGYQILTTCLNEEKEELQKILPQISSHHILNSRSKLLNKEIKQATKGRGANVVINTQDDHKLLETSLSCAARRALFFQINKTPMKNDSSIGLSVLLRGILISAVDVKGILNLCEVEKRKLQSAVQTGLNEGVVKPLKIKKVRNILTSRQAVHLLESHRGKNEKLIMPMDARKVSSEFYLCDSEKSYLLMGGNEGLWLGIMEWLILRGAEMIFVVLEHPVLPTDISLRCESIMAQYPIVEIHFLPWPQTPLETSTGKLINVINEHANLAATFVSDLESSEVLNFLSRALQFISPKSDFICFGVGSCMCEERNKIGLPGMALIWRDNISNHNTILSHLDDLLLQNQLPNRDPTISLLEYDVTNPESKLNVAINCLPKDLNAIRDLSYNLSSTPRFEEITTLSPPYISTTGKMSDPVLLIPGLMHDDLDNYASKLMYPTFKCKLPEKISSVESVACSLVKTLEKVKSNLFTIVANDWGGALAFEIAKILEKQGKKIVLVLVDAIPQTAQYRTKLILDSQFNILLEKYFIVPSVRKNSLNWDEKWNYLINSHVGEIDEAVKRGINAVKSRLEALAKYMPKGKLSCKTYLLRGIPSFKSDGLLESFLQQPLEVILTNDLSHQNLLHNQTAVQAINNVAAADELSNFD